MLSIPLLFFRMRGSDTDLPSDPGRPLEGGFDVGCLPLKDVSCDGGVEMSYRSNEVFRGNGVSFTTRGLDTGADCVPWIPGIFFVGTSGGILRSFEGDFDGGSDGGSDAAIVGLHFRRKSRASVDISSSCERLVKPYK